MGKVLQEKFNSIRQTLSPVQLPRLCLNISDIHAAAGGPKDPLVDSGVEPILTDVLEKYFANGYWLLKNGDWWDTWRGESLTKIFPAHRELVTVVDQYKNNGRLHEVLGNHERDLCTYPEAIIFEGYGKKIFMFHGYFGDWPNDEGWQIGRDVVKIVNELGIDPAMVPPTSPHPSNIERHLAVRKDVQELADNNPEWDFLWGHTHYFSNEGNNHNSGSSLIGFVQGYTIEEGNFIPFERK
jgi:hypothetical protein